MNPQPLTNLTALDEGFTTEFKRSGTSNLGREICAFANATGGVILIGVTDDGQVVGVGDHNRLKSEVQSIARSADPPIGVEVESIADVLCITVPGQHSKPYSFGGKFFIREGASSQQMSRDEIREFFYAEGLIHFDETPCERFSLEFDLDDEVWALFRRRAKIPAEMEPVTALAHRDYRSTANVQVYLFKDRIEIVSPGGLPAGMTEADLRGQECSPKSAAVRHPPPYGSGGEYRQRYPADSSIVQRTGCGGACV